MAECLPLMWGSGDEAASEGPDVLECIKHAIALQFGKHFCVSAKACCKELWD